jgi:hypothetical protein
LCSAAAERAGIENEIALFRQIAPHSENPLLNELIEARACHLFASLDLMLASLQPGPETIAASTRLAAELVDEEDSQ